MAARPRRIIAVALVVALTSWAVIVTGALVSMRGAFGLRASSPVSTFPAGEMRVGVDASYPPFAVATADDLYGLDIDLARAIGDRLGVPVRFVNLGYDGLYDALRVDQVDVLISAVLVDPARRDEVLYTTPYFNAGLVLVGAAGTPYVDMQAVVGHRLSYEFGSTADTEARAWMRRVLPFESRPYELSTYALDAVRLGEADAALVDAITARLYLREHPAWGAQYHYVTDSWLALAVRIDRGAAYNDLNYALQSLIEDGTMNALHERWL